MPTRNLLSGPITYSAARKRDENILNELAYVPATQELHHRLWESKEAISAVVKHHLRLSQRDVCYVPSPENWIRGSFNICIPVTVKARDGERKVMMRCPMPHKLAEDRCPGTVNERLGCEVGTYAWMQENCRGIRIPILYGFGFSDQRHFTHEQQRPWFVRLVQSLWRVAYRLLGYHPLSRYVPDHTASKLPSAYMLLEFIEPGIGQMLSMSWETGRHGPSRRQKLFHGIAGVMLALARVPCPRIGAFRFNDDCTVTLTNRPLTCTMMILENDGAPRNIPERETYSQTDSFVSDMLSFHNHHFLSNPNAIISANDCRTQMSNRTLLRTLSHHYIQRELRNGPFFLQFTDFHASNIFVDEEWNITCLLDLEWVCALPAEMLAVPYWLTGRAIDEIDEEHIDEFNQVRHEFMQAFEMEEGTGGEEKTSISSLSLARIMEKTWESKGVWYWYCLGSINATRFILEDHVLPVFSSLLSLKSEEVLSRFWGPDAEEIVRKKVTEYENYKIELQRAFGENMVGETPGS